MKIQVLAVTMDQTDDSILERMNIQTDALIGNQCGENRVEQQSYREHEVTFYHFRERGVGLNRNNLLMRSDADICILADDDMRFVDGYEEKTAALFARYPDADMLVFNLIEKDPRRFVNQQVFRVTRRNFGKYGAARIAFRRKRVIQKGIFFHLMFGGGAVYSAGEDSIFLSDCLKKGLRIYAVPESIAEIDKSSESSWFKGYNQKFFTDRGALFATMSPHLAPLYALRYAVVKRKKYAEEATCRQAIGWMLDGIQKVTGNE